MAIKAGQILHDANGYVIDRIQSGGVTNLNIPEEKVYELGNYETVTTVTDIPELTFEIESLDVVPELEAILVGKNPTSLSSGEEIDFVNHIPIDVVSPFKSGNGAFDVIRGIAVPYLTLETVTYRMGLRQNASQTFSLRGDTVNYVPGTPYRESFSLSGSGTGPFALNNVAIKYTESGNTIHTLGVCVKNPTTGDYQRLFYDSGGTDSLGYTENVTPDTSHTATVTVSTVTDWEAAGYTQIDIVYGSTVTATYAQSVHPTDSTKPGAVRPKDICVYVSDGYSGSTPNSLLKWTGVQSFEITRRVNLENDEEFCNTKYVAVDYDTAEVTGSINVKSVDAEDLFNKIADIAGVLPQRVSGPFSPQPLEIEVVISDPDTGNTLKTLYCEDAKFTLPAVQGRVQQKLEVPFNFTSNGGNLKVYNGDRP